MTCLAACGDTVVRVRVVKFTKSKLHPLSVACSAVIL